MTEPRQEIIDYRLARARESLQEADLLAGESRWIAAVNRLYYSSFYAVSGLLLARGLSAKQHRGVRHLFNQHVVRTGEVSRELGAIFNDLFENRHKGDYMDLVRFEPTQVQEWIAQARQFVDAIALLVEQSRS